MTIRVAYIVLSDCFDLYSYMMVAWIIGLQKRYKTIALQKSASSLSISASGTA
ncbi:hypothetical protein [Alicyclobacillus fodiniaquatilis]|uniref:Uncharacterized protein n=1 Tax=Alicyclobacillus fodiniaquatilis TaxID=1661150 RepID=A0ABW4JK43_9BACL